MLTVEKNPLSLTVNDIVYQ